MKLVTLAKITLNHLPNRQGPVTFLRVAADERLETLRELVLSSALEHGENRSLTALDAGNKTWNSVDFDIRFNPNHWSSQPYAECNIISSALEIDGRYFKLDEVIA